MAENKRLLYRAVLASLLTPSATGDNAAGRRSGKRKSRYLMAVVIPFVLLSVFFCGCGSRPADQKKDMAAADVSEKQEARLQIVTTIFPQYDFARHIAGDSADVYMLLKPGEEVHSYEPTPKDIRMIQSCDLFIYTGGENDVWIDSILESISAESGDGPEGEKPDVHVNRPRPHAVRFLDLVDTYAEEQLEGMMPEKGGHDHTSAEEESHDHDAETEAPDHGEPEHEEHREEKEEHDHDAGSEVHDHHGEPDEHVWTSPANCAVLIEKLTEEFCELDPQRADQYRANGDAYQREFEALDAEYREMIRASERKTIIFGDRFPFRYLAEAYGLTCYAAFSGCSAESEPSAATIAFLIEKASEEEVPVIFQLEFSNGNIARAVSEAVELRLRKNGKTEEEKNRQIQVLRLHSCHNLTRDEFDAGETCLSLMKKNLEAIRTALN